MPETYFPPKLLTTRTEVSVPRSSAMPVLTTVTAHATPHTKGNWVELLASTSAAADCIVVYALNSSFPATDSAMLMDIGTGAAASEVVRVPDLNVAGRTGTFDQETGAWEIPLRIPAGTRIAARTQAVTTVDTVEVGLEVYNGVFFDQFKATTLTAYGVNSSTSRGVSVPAGLSGAEGAWTEITNATSKDHRGLMVSIGIAGDTTMNANDYQWDLATGAASSEVVRITDRLVQSGSNETWADGDRARVHTPLWIPGGTRIAMRLSGLPSGGQSADFVVHGLD